MNGYDIRSSRVIVIGDFGGTVRSSDVIPFLYLILIPVYGLWTLKERCA